MTKRQHKVIRDQERKAAQGANLSGVCGSLESVYTEGPYDSVLAVVCDQCGVDYRKAFESSGRKVFAPRERQKETANSASARRTIMLTEPVKASGKPRFGRRQLSDIAYVDDYADAVAA